MLIKSTRTTAVILLLSGLLGVVALSALPPDIPAGAFRDDIEAVITRVGIGIRLGLYPFDSNPVDLGPGIQVFLTRQQFRPPNALEALERGFPIARLSTSDDLLISGVTIPEGQYYLVLWISSWRFERFGIEFLPRVPILIFVTEQRLEPVDFTIPCKVEVEVPNKNPDKIFPLMMGVAPLGACRQSASAAASLGGLVTVPQEVPGIQVSIWGIGAITILGDPHENVDSLPIPPAEELFPEEKPEEEPPDGEEPPPPNK